MDISHSNACSTFGQFDGKKSWFQLDMERTALAMAEVSKREQAAKQTRRKAKIVRVEIVSARRAGWSIVKVREITEGGRAVNVVEFDRSDEAERHARPVAARHGVKIVRPR